MFDAVTCAIPGGRQPNRLWTTARASDLPPVSYAAMKQVAAIYAEKIAPLGASALVKDRSYMIQIRKDLTPAALEKKVKALFESSARKIKSLDADWKPERGAPVFTINGKYTSRGWTEWTQGFQFGAEILQFDATGEKEFLEAGKAHTVAYMASHVSHIGVHDHGFNNVSTYGNLLRLMNEAASRKTRASATFTNWP